MWYQTSWFGRSIKTLLERSWFDPHESFECSVTAYQAPKSLLFSNLPRDVVSWVFTVKLVCSGNYLHTKCVVIVVLQHRGISINARGCISLPFQKFLNTQVRAKILSIENKVKCLAVTKATRPTKAIWCYVPPCSPPCTKQYISLFDVSEVHEPLTARKRCQIWGLSHRNKTRFACGKCGAPACKELFRVFCPNCWNKSVECSLVFVVYRGVTRLDSARGKKQVWRPHVRTWDLLEANLLLKEVLVILLGLFDAPRSVA